MTNKTLHIPFTKMHGIGNDYIYINCLETPIDNPSLLSIEMSPRHTSIGSDGIILICRSEIADFKMRIFNADGSEALMCGNGCRCVGKYVYDHNLTNKTELTLETLSGVKHLYLHVNKNTDKVNEVTVDMGSPSFNRSAIGLNYPQDEMIEARITTSLGEKAITGISMGNPHGVIFINTLDGFDITHIGPELENHSMWNDRANIEFAEVVDEHTIKMRVWERGSGETMACGTGACATAVAAIRTGRAVSPVTVKLLGGDLKISIEKSTGHVMMQGSATEVFTGIYCRC
ncbi:MAG: diaminopimelate epimerase [Muribaculaceae bacterium]|nr:diaminopimelate epimerase [Muribaculaceae bacterium]